MGRELTARYASALESQTLRHPLRFVRDVYAAGKLRELTSFAVWEAQHRLGLAANWDSLAFTDRHPLSLSSPLDPSQIASDLADVLGPDLAAEPCTEQWKLLFLTGAGRIIGCMYPDDRALYDTPAGAGARCVARFPERIKALYVSRHETIFVSVKGGVYRCPPHGGSFDRVLDFASPESFFRHNNAMTELPDGTLVIGEYGNVWERGRWRPLAYLYFSRDDGQSWHRSDFLIRRGINKHVHVVRYSPLLDALLVADGDNHKKLWIATPSESRDPADVTWKPVTRHHLDMGGYTSIVESGGKIFFGTDYQGGTNFIVESTDGLTFTRRVVPDPYRRSPVDNMVVRSGRRCDEIWANLPYSSGAGRSLLMFSPDAGKVWHKVIEYRRRAHTVWLVSSSADPVDAVFLSIEDMHTGDRLVFRIVDR